VGKTDENPHAVNIILVLQKIAEVVLLADKRKYG
jgi:hypothetical protein